jgi:glycerol-3-phosphate dehydrogenase (NAD(P)+)
MSRIAVIGSGAWGTALALHLERNHDHQISLWSYSKSVAKSLLDKRVNTQFLPGFPVPEEIKVTTSLTEAITNADLVIAVVPSQHMRAVMEQLAPRMRPGQVVISATKGIEDRTFLRMSEVISDVLRKSHDGTSQNPIAVLSGPSFAQEVAAGKTTALTLAVAGDTALASRLRADFSSPAFRVYTSDDVIGVEIGGALKNVIAIAAGIAAGLDLGTNGAAALITRGLAEITRLAVACGGRAETLAGLAGMGDLVLTTTGGLSRNRTVGLGLGKGQSLEETLEQLHGKVAEGVQSTTAALGLARKFGVELPITEQIEAILHRRKLPIDAIRELMTRPGRGE